MIQSEIDTLIKYAALVPRGGRIVEIGTHMGDSTIVMAKAAPKAKVWTIDTGDRWLWEEGGKGDLAEYVRILKRRFEAYPDVFIMLGSSHSGAGHVVKWTGEPIDLLFVDGNHNYDPFMADLVRWAPKIRPGGYMLLHDYVDGDTDKVWGAANDYLAGYPQWEVVELVDTMLVLRKRNHLQ